jgi:hypothetical protein
MAKRTIKELIELHGGKSNTNLSIKELIELHRNKNDKENETIDELIEKQIKKRIKESDAMFKYFGRI